MEREEHENAVRVSDLTVVAVVAMTLVFIVIIDGFSWQAALSMLACGIFGIWGFRRGDRD